MKKQARKIAAAAGLIRMVKWMGLRLGRAKVDKDGGGGDGSGSDDDGDSDGGKKKKGGGGQKDGGKAGGGGRAGKAAAPHYGPWIANGLLQRTHPKSLDFPTISKRLEASRKVRVAGGGRGTGLEVILLILCLASNFPHFALPSVIPALSPCSHRAEAEDPDGHRGGRQDGCTGAIRSAGG